MGLFFKHEPPPRRKTGQNLPVLRGGLSAAPRFGARKLIIAQADYRVVAAFLELQSIWRRQGTLRKTYRDMPCSPAESRAWERLLHHLMQLPPPRD
jgi:hypothetical protein